MTGSSGWTFLSNHGHVLICIARDPDIRLRDVAATVGVTERCVQQIVLDLERAHVLARTRTGRRNHYRVDREAPLRHPLEAGGTVGVMQGETTSGPTPFRPTSPRPPVRRPSSC